MKVRVYSHAGLRTGYGHASVGLCRALLAAGCDLELRPLHRYGELAFDGEALPLASRVYPDARLDPNPDVVIVHTLPADCGKVLLIASETTKAAQWVAYTTWEGAGRFPKSITDTLVGFDQVWVPSRHNLEALGSFTDKDQKHWAIPHTFDEARLDARPRQSTHADANRFTFYYIGAWTHRKNPSGVIRAFAHAFTKADEVELWIQSAGAPSDSFVIAAAATGLTQAELPAMKFGGGFISEEAIRAIHDDADVFVTATRGEAWNLPAFEAMLAGRHVIVPVGQGSDEFLARSSADLYPGMLVPAAVDVRASPAQDHPGEYQMQTIGAQGLTSRSMWIEPDLGALAARMRHAYENKIREISLDYDPRERFGYQAVGRLAKSALEAT